MGISLVGQPLVAIQADEFRCLDVGRTRTGIGLVDLTASFTDGRGQVGRSYTEIAKRLNRAGFLTARGGVFQATQVIRLAKSKID